MNNFKDDTTISVSSGWKHHTRAKCLALANGYFYLDRTDPNSWYWLFKYESGL